MIGAVVGSICSGGSGPSRVSAPPPDNGDPAATSAYSSTVSTGTAAVAVSVQSAAWALRLGAETSSGAVIFDQLADEFGVAPLPGDGERARQDAGGDVRRPPHARVGIGHRVPHRVDGEGGGHLEFGGLLEFGRCVRGIGQRLGPQDAAEMVVEPGVLQPAAAGPRIEQAPRLVRACSAAASKSPRKMSTQLRCNRIRWMCSGFSTSRQCRSACPKRSSASSSASIDRLIRPKYSQHLDTSCAR